MDGIIKTESDESFVRFMERTIGSGESSEAARSLKTTVEANLMRLNGRERDGFLEFVSAYLRTASHG
jgi:hypothetical protein